jgi:hypothetical protein
MSEQSLDKETSRIADYRQVPYREIAAFAMASTPLTPGLERLAKVAVLEANLDTASLELAASTEIVVNPIDIEAEMYENHPPENLRIEPVAFLNNMRQLANDSSRLLPRHESDNQNACQTTMELIAADRAKFREVHRAYFGDQPGPSEDDVDFVISNLMQQELGGYSAPSGLFKPGQDGIIDSYSNAATIQLARSLLNPVRAIYSLARLSAQENYTPPLHYINPDDTAAVFKEVYSQWGQYMLLAREHGVETLGKILMNPLIYNDVGSVKTLIAEGRVAAAEVIQISYSRPRVLMRNYQRADTRNQTPKEPVTRARPKRIPRERPVKLDQSRKAELDRRAKSILEQDNYRNFAVNRSADSALMVESPAEIDDAIFAVCAQQVLAAQEQYGAASKSVWPGRNLNKISETIRPRGFNGKMDNYRLIHLPVTDEFTAKYLKTATSTDDIDRDTISRIGIFADMSSTGRGLCGQSFQDVVVYTRNIADPARRSLVLSIRGKASGEQVAAYLRQESITTAVQELTHNLRHPYRGGLPSLGKQR